MKSALSMLLVIITASRMRYSTEDIQKHLYLEPYYFIVY